MIGNVFYCNASYSCARLRTHRTGYTLGQSWVAPCAYGILLALRKAEADVAQHRQELLTGYLHLAVRVEVLTVSYRHANGFNITEGVSSNEV